MLPPFQNLEPRIRWSDPFAAPTNRLHAVPATASWPGLCRASSAPLVSVSSTPVACSFPCLSCHPCLPCLLLFQFEVWITARLIIRNRREPTLPHNCGQEASLQPKPKFPCAHTMCSAKYLAPLSACQFFVAHRPWSVAFDFAIPSFVNVAHGIQARATFAPHRALAMPPVSALQRREPHAAPPLIRLGVFSSK
jgi:hypothetical protein